VEAGAQRLHLVDLNGAFAGKPVNKQAIQNIVTAYPDIPVEVGGGIRDKNTIESYLDLGVKYVIIGTKAVTSPHFVEDACIEFGDHIIVGLDAKNGKVAIDGWSKLSHHDAMDMAKRFEQAGVSAIIYTDISRDGMMQGMNMSETAKLANFIGIPVIASGGITGMDDIRALCAIKEDNIIGAIVGRALYEGTVDFVEAQKLAEGCGDS
jgi:phosphoribosylformimino-5-aminoimidazole carboxamide ribotide isomerase